MNNIHRFFIFLLILTTLLLISDVCFSDQFVVVDRENGDRLTGRFLGATDTHFEIEYNGQVLKFPLKGHRIDFTSDVDKLPDRIAANHYDKGQQLLKLEQPELAKRKFEAALEEFPMYADAHYQLGLLYQHDGDMEKTLARFRSVLLIDTEKFDLFPILEEIGENAVNTEEYAQAVNAYQLILKHYPEHEGIASITYRTGFLLMKELADPVAGLDILNDAVLHYPLSPENEEAVYLIGVSQAETGEYENALKTLKNFMNNYPDSNWRDDAQLKRAIIYLQIGETENAVNEAKFVRMQSDDLEIIAQASEVLQASAWNIYTQYLPDTNIQALAVDGTSLWVGTSKGIAQIETEGRGKWKANEAVAVLINEHLPTVPDVRAIATNVSGVWVGTRNHGILHYNKLTNQVNNYSVENGFPSAWVRDIQMDDKEIWFATDDGIVRIDIASGKQYPYPGNSHVPEDVNTIALTPDTVWVGSADATIAFYDRGSGVWDSRSFVDVDPSSKIVKFDVVDKKMMFSWYNEEKRENGFFIANWDGMNGESYPLLTGLTDETALADILVTGEIETTVNNDLEGDESISTPLVLWVAMNDSVTIYDTRIRDFLGALNYPKIVLSDSTVQCIVVDKNRAWIGTSKGMLTIDKDKLSQMVEP